ncbi:GntR family transcriptional regulator [Cupriavidus basilensis]|uniref:GntR family transcriptional regulator n=1 Tax=Cupriavidus basilensis TaxID=68895 RepID=A0ABT6B381_9BURK|nr:GntR family transcriptional regulator [Cupriavidus basilensis]MDF3839318.1 GntR family transcriptional regulator [Cupriavidus basilensis]
MHAAPPPSFPRSRPPLPKVSRQWLHDAVVEHLRSLIVEGALAAGQKLNERELCEVFGISRTPLREAMKVLAAEGLIVLAPNRGASVASMSELEIREAFEVLGGLEALAGQLACERISEAELLEIRGLHQSMLACRTRNDLAGYYSRNQMIHDKINEAARNTSLRQIYLGVNRRLQALRFRSNFQAPKWDSAVHDHAQMLLALEARDGIRLAAILQRHLLDKREAVLGTAAAPCEADSAACSEIPSG